MEKKAIIIFKTETSPAAVEGVIADLISNACVKDVTDFHNLIVASFLMDDAMRAGLEEGARKGRRDAYFDQIAARAWRSIKLPAPVDVQVEVKNNCGERDFAVLAKNHWWCSTDDNECGTYYFNPIYWRKVQP